MNLFVDSSMFSAAVDDGDERHADARRVLVRGDTLLPSDHVLGTDRTSFAVMLRLGIHRAASLDKDFAVFRFGPRRDRTFEIAR